MWYNADIEKDILMKQGLFIFTVIIATIIAGAGLHAQEAVKVKKSEFKKQQIGFQEAWKSIKLGNRYYMQGEGMYREAREEYLKAYNYNSSNPELNYMIGKCYLYSDDKFESINFISKAFDFKADVNFDIHLLLGMAFHQVHKFDRAIEEYNRFLTSLDKKMAPRYQKVVAQYIRQCENGKLLVAEPIRVVINNPGMAINSVYDEYTPILSGDEDMMYFTSRRKLELESERSILDSKYYEDVYYSELKNGDWSRARRFNEKVNSKKNNTNVAIVGLSPDGKEIYLYKGKENNGDIFVSELSKKGEYKKLKPIKRVNSKHRERSFALSHDGKTLYFASDNPKTGYGGSDLYYCTRKETGKWDKPRNLGSRINTFQDEISISLSPNDSILYFSSEGHNSMGGFDVFKSTREDEHSFSEPVNLGYPINTPNNDVFYFPLKDNKTAYYSSNREAGVGGMDIYRIIYLGAEKDMLMSDAKREVAGVIPPYESIFFQIPQYVEIDSSLLLTGNIIDSESKKPVIAKVEIVDNQLNKVVATEIAGEQGAYLMKLPSAKTYGVEITADNYLLFLDMVNLDSNRAGDVVHKNFELIRVEVGAKMILTNIYFESAKATLKDESFEGLDKIVRLLQNNSNIRIEISGHTDNVGSDKTNLKLSNDRAKSVVAYLIKKGIPESRLEYKGYGESQPIAGNDTPEGRSQNRRVEFKVIGK